MTEKHTPVAHVCFDKIEEELFLTGPGKDTKPLYSAETVEQLESESEALRKQVEELLREKYVLRATIEIARQHPGFDAGGPIAEMLDEALAGKTPHIVEALDRLVPLVPYNEQGQPARGTD